MEVTSHIKPTLLPPPCLPCLCHAVGLRLHVQLTTVRVFLLRILTIYALLYGFFEKTNLTSTLSASDDDDAATNTTTVATFVNGTISQVGALLLVLAALWDKKEEEEEEDMLCILALK